MGIKRSIVSTTWVLVMSCLLSVGYLGRTALADSPASPAASAGVGFSLPADGQVTLEQALAVAFANSPELRVALDSVEKSHGVIDEAKARFRPTVGTRLTYTYTDPARLSQTANRPVATLTAAVPVDLSHQLGYARDLAAGQEQLQAVTLRATAARLVLNVKNAYYGVLRAHARLEVNKAAVATAQAQVEDSRVKQEAGAVPLFDVTTAQVNLANLSQQLIAAQNQLAMAQAALSRVLGLDVETAIKAAPVELKIQADPTGPAAGLAKAADRRPEIQAAERGVELAKTGVALQRAAAKPTVALTGGPNYVVDSPVPGWNGWSWQAGVTVNLPLIDGGAVAAKVREAQADLASATHALGQARLTVAQDVRTATLNLQEAALRTQSTAAAVDLAETALGLARDRYEAGIAVLMEVTNAQSQLIQAQFNHVNAQYDYAVALAQLQWASATQPELEQLLAQTNPSVVNP